MNTSKASTKTTRGRKSRVRALSSKHLAALDLLITTAQSRGAGLKTKLSNTEEQAEAQAQLHEAMWDARHGGLRMRESDVRTVQRIRELAATLEFAPTLGQLVALRGQMLNNRRG